MLSKTQIKLIKSLHQKKYRCENNLFIAEGSKIVTELIHYYPAIKYLITTENWLHKNIERLPSFPIEPTIIKEEIYQSISTLINPDKIMAVANIPKNQINQQYLNNNYSLYLDNIKDPGNMGTIIRTADWFGIKQIFCSPECVDIYNPKVIQASMGSFLRVNTIENIDYSYFKQLATTVPLLGMCLDGNNIYTTTISKPAIIIIGSESHGISNDLLPLITKKITIPRFSEQNTGSNQPESLNAAIATAIICSEINKNNLKYKPEI